MKINSYYFYKSYHGHNIRDLKILYKGLKRLNPMKNFIYLAGDSSLDNKYWIDNEYRIAINDYEKILEPTVMKPDICYHLNNLSNKYYTINCAVEGSTINNRQETGLFCQEKFIRSNITKNDILIVSVGGNDIALSPSAKTIWNMILLVYFNSLDTLLNNCQNAWGFTHFVKMFKTDVKNYILKIIGQTRPKKILVCMIYFPYMKVNNSWADKTLGYLGYNTNPEKLQAAIKQIFHYATSKIKIRGSKVIPVPMFNILDGKTSSDYVQRVEPSTIGGEKLAKLFLTYII